MKKLIIFLLLLGCVNAVEPLEHFANDAGGNIIKTQEVISCPTTDLTSGDQIPLSSAARDNISTDDLSFIYRGYDSNTLCRGYKTVVGGITENLTRYTNITLTIKYCNNNTANNLKVFLWNYTTDSWTTTLAEGTFDCDNGVSELTHELIPTSDIINASGYMNVLTGANENTGNLWLFYLEVILNRFAENVTIQYHIDNINTLDGIEDVNITLDSNNGLTDSGGNLLFGTVLEGTYSETLVKQGYQDQARQKAIIGSENIILAMTPISNEGIIRLVGSDFYEKGRVLCFYYEENDRLHGCYHTNETIRLLINRGYVVRPKLTQNDLIRNPALMGTHYYLYIPLILFLMVGLFVGGIILTFIVTIILRHNKRGVQG